MVTVAESGGAGRARSAIPLDDVGQTTPPHTARASSRWRPEPVATADEVEWGNPMVRTYLVNLLDDPTGPFAAIDSKSRALCKQLLHHRNPRTGDLFPSCGLLAFELPFKERSIRYALGRLDTGPSRQRDGQLVDGHGLVWRRKRWRRYGGQTSNAYGFTCKFMELAGLVLPHDPASCSVCSGAAPKAKAPGSRRGRPPRPVSASLPLPKVQPPATTSTPMDAPAADPDFETLALIFAAERATKYGDHDAGTVREEKRGAIASYVLEITAEACAWAQGRGLELDRGAVREELCRRLVRLWLDMPGTNGFLTERRHPIGLIVGDLQRVGPEALAAWKRAQPRPKVALSLAMLGEQEDAAPTSEAYEGEAWPELDASEPTDDELAGDAVWPPPNHTTEARAEAREGRVSLALTGDAAFDRAAEQTRACSPVAFDQWFVGVQFEGLADGVLSLRAQNEFVRDWIQQRFLGTLTDKVREQIGARVGVKWTIDPHLSLPLVRRLPAPSAIDDEPRVAARVDELRDDDEPRDDEPRADGDELHDEPEAALLEDGDELAPVHAKRAEIEARGGGEARRPALPSLTAASSEAAPAPEPAEEPFTRGVYGTVNGALAEFLRAQAARSRSEPTPRRGGSLRTRLALRSRPVGAAPPEAEEEAAEAEEGPSEASTGHPRRRHTRSRLGLSYEHAGPTPPPEAAVEPPREGDGEQGDEEEKGPVSKR